MHPQFTGFCWARSCDVSPPPFGSPSSPPWARNCPVTVPIVPPPRTVRPAPPHRRGPTVPKLFPPPWWPLWGTRVRILDENRYHPAAVYAVPHSGPTRPHPPNRVDPGFFVKACVGPGPLRDVAGPGPRYRSPLRSGPKTGDRMVGAFASTLNRAQPQPSPAGFFLSLRSNGPTAP